MNILLIGPDSAARAALAARLRAFAPLTVAGAAPTEFVPGQLVVTLGVEQPLLAELCARARDSAAAAFVFAFASEAGLAAQTALLDAGAHDCAWLGIDDDALAVRLAVARQRLGYRRAHISHDADAAARVAMLIDSTEDAIIARDGDGRVTIWNRGAEELYGFTALEALGSTVRDIMPPPDSEEVRRITRSLRAGEVVSLETTRPRKNGDLVDLALTILPVRNAAGQVAGSVSVARDIGRARRLRDEVALLQAVVASATDAIIVRDPGGKVLLWNGGAERVYGYTSAEAVGQPASFLSVPESPLRTATFGGEFAARYLADARQEMDRIRKDGVRIRVEVDTFPVRDADGRVIAVGGVSRDATERRRLDEERALVAAIVGASDDAIVSIGLDARVTSWNRGAELVYGYTAEEMVGSDAARLVPEAHRAGYAEFIAGLRNGRSAYHMELPGLRKDGTEVLLSAAAFPLRDANGEVVACASISRDVTEKRRTEAALRDSEANYRAIVEGTSDSLFVVDVEPDGGYRVHMVNGFLETLAGQPNSAIAGRPLRELLTPKRFERVTATYARVIAARAPIEVGERFTIAGAFVDVTTRLTPMFDEAGRCHRIVGSLRDVTAEKAAEAARREAEAHLRTLVANAPMLISVFDAEGYNHLSMGAALELLGRGQDETAGKHYTEYYVPGSPVTAIMAAALMGVPGEIDSERPDGRVLHFTYAPQFDDDGQVRGVTVVGFEVTERVRAEEARQRADANYRAVVEGTSDALYVMERGADGQFRCTVVNQAYSRLLDRDPLDYLGKTLHETHDPESAARILEHYDKAMELGAPVHWESVSEVRGQELILAIQVTPVLDDHGDCFRLIGSMRDITMRRQAEAAQRRAEVYLRTLVDGAPIVIMAVDGEGLITFTAGAGLESLGSFPGDAIGENARDLYPGIPAVAAAVDTALAGDDVGIEVEVAGHVWDARYSPLRDAAGGVTGAIAVVFDITERRAVEATLLTEKAFSDATIDSLPGIFYLSTPSGRILRTNRMFRSVTGYDEDDIPGLDARELFGEGDSDSRGGSISGAMSAGTATAEADLVRKDGSAVRYFFTARRIDIGGEACVIGMGIDVSERAQLREARRIAEEALVQAQKLESLGVLAGGIAHDFNNLLVGILGNAGLALAELGPTSPARATIQDIETAGRRAADLARQMLAYSGKGRFIVQPLGLNELVEEMTHLLRVSIAHGATLSYDLAPGLPPVEVDATQIRQVVMNLVVNASDAIGDSEGVIVVSTGVIDATRADLDEFYLSPGLPVGRYVFLEVRDTGVGMDAGTMARIFDPFFTTKFTGRGLGLAAVLGIMRGHRGAIRVSSEPGRGTTFRFLLPAVASSDEPAPVAEDGPAAWRGSGAILVVDDEPAVLAVTSRALALFGFDVIEAADGEAGVAAFAEHAGIRCVLLDMTMPRLNGAETFAAMQRIRPGVPVVLMSGYSEEDAATQFGPGGPAGFIEKPYDLRTLREVLRATLG